MKTETKQQHTPTPWKFQGENIVNGSRDGNFAIFAKGEVIATAVGKADAAFIVRAVNSHEALLEIAKKLQNALSKQWIKSVESEDIEADKNLSKYVSMLYGELSDAIAQAEKGE